MQGTVMMILASRFDMSSQSISNDCGEFARERTMISSILHTEFKCVSISSIAMDTNLSRFEACRVLDNIVTNCNESTQDCDSIQVPIIYESTECIIFSKKGGISKNNTVRNLEEDYSVPCTVFKLITRLSNDVTDRIGEIDGTVVAVAIAASQRTTMGDQNHHQCTLDAESFSVAHESYMQRYCYRIQEKTFHQFFSSISFNDETTTTKITSFIQPSNEVKYRVASKISTFENDSKQISKFDDTPAGRLVNATNETTVRAQQTNSTATRTSAAIFFKDSKTNNGIDKNSGNAPKSNDFLGHSQSKTSNEKFVNDGSDGKENTDAQQRSQVVKVSNDHNNRKLSTQVSSSFVVKNTVGNADDFAGDADDDDDQDEEICNEVDVPDEQSRSLDVDTDSVLNYERKNHKQLINSKRSANKMVSRNYGCHDENILTEESHDDRGLKKQTVSHKSGAMDGFVVAAASSSNANIQENTVRGRRLRKILQEEEFLDSKGYLRIEMKEKWVETEPGEDNENFMNDNLRCVDNTDSASTKSKPNHIGSGNSSKQEMLDGKKKAGSQKQANKKSSASGIKTNLKQGNLMGFWSKK